MEIIEIVFLPIIIVLGLAACFSDIKEGKIRNKHLLLAMLAAIAAYAALFFLGMADSGYLGRLSVNFLLSLLFSILLWQADVWSAADAKLFSVYSLLVPLTFYRNTYINFFPSFIILVNTFVPFFMYSFARAVFATGLKQKKEAIRSMNLLDLLLLLLSVFWISWIPKLIDGVFRIKMDFAAVFILIFAVYMLLKLLPKSRLWIISVIFCFIRAVFDFKDVLTMDFLRLFAALFLLILLIIFAVAISSARFIKRINAEELKPGMVLSEGSVRRLRGLGIKKSMLAGNAVNKIKKKYKGDAIEIEQTVPFSPFILAGIVLTIIARGNFLLLANYLR